MASDTAVQQCEAEAREPLNADSIAKELPGYFDVRAWATRRPSRTVVAAKKIVAGKEAAVEIELRGWLSQDLLDDAWLSAAAAIRHHMADFEQRYQDEVKSEERAMRQVAVFSLGVAFVLAMIGLSLWLHVAFIKWAVSL